MNLKSLLFPTLLLTSCVAPPKYQDLTLEGAAADAAFHQWSAALPWELAYPVDFRFDLEFSFSGMPAMDGAEAKLHMGTDASFKSAWECRTRTDFSLAVLDEQVGFQLGVFADAQDLLMSFDHTELLETIVGMSLPAGASLTTDRLHRVWDLMMQLSAVATDSVEGYPEMEHWMEIYSGFGDILHPMLNSRYLALSPMLIAERWQVEGNMVSVEFGIHREMLESMLASPALAEFGIEVEQANEIADGLAAGVTFDVVDGSMTSMLITGAIPITDEFGSVTALNFSIAMDYAPLVADIAPIEFSADSTVVDLNTYFDEYWPMVEAIMPLVEAQLRQQMVDQSGDDAADFDF